METARDEVSAPLTAPGVSSTVTPPVEENASSRFADDVTIEVVRRAWPRILTIFRQSSPQGAAFLEKAEPVALDGKVIVLQFCNAFARDRIQNNEKGRIAVEKVINRALNIEGYKIRCIMADNNDGGGSGVAAPVEMPPGSPPSAATIEMAALLDAPPVESKASKRIADFDIPPASSSQTYAYQKEESRGADTVAETSETDSILPDVLNMFGGEVISTSGN